MKKNDIKPTKTNIRAITEAYRYYQLLDDECHSLIPDSFVEFLNTFKDLSVGEPLHPEIPLEMQNISQEGWVLIAQFGRWLK